MTRSIQNFALLDVPIILEANEVQRRQMVGKERNKKIQIIEKLTTDIIKAITSPYVLFAHNHFDFDLEDSNIWRMVREAELQNADVVTGAYQNQHGEWEHRNRG